MSQRDIQRTTYFVQLSKNKASNLPYPTTY